MDEDWLCLRIKHSTIRKLIMFKIRNSHSMKYTLLLNSLGPARFVLKEIHKCIQQGNSKVTDIIYISNKCCSFELILN